MLRLTTLCRAGLGMGECWGGGRCVHASLPESLCSLPSLLLRSFWPGLASSFFFSHNMCIHQPPHSHPSPAPRLVSPKVSLPRSSGVFKGSLWVTICPSLLTNWIWGWGTSCMSHSWVGSRVHIRKALVAPESSRTPDVG